MIIKQKIFFDDDNPASAESALGTALSLTEKTGIAMYNNKLHFVKGSP